MEVQQPAGPPEQPAPHPGQAQYPLQDIYHQPGMLGGKNQSM